MSHDYVDEFGWPLKSWEVSLAESRRGDTLSHPKYKNDDESYPAPRAMDSREFDRLNRGGEDNDRR